MPLKKGDTPVKIKPYLYHGMDLEIDSKESVGDCPFCGRESKFSINNESGLWRCMVCSEGSNKGGGNAYTFIQLLHEHSKSSWNIRSLAENRKLLDVNTLKLWEVSKSILNDRIQLPGYNADGTLTQLYQYRTIGSKRQLLPTPELGHALHGVNLFDPNQETVYLTEGPWDGMVLYELLEEGNVLSLPGINTFNEKWLKLFIDKEVVILFDNDHEKIQCKCKKMYSRYDYTECPKCGSDEVTGIVGKPAAFEQVKRIASILKANKIEKVKYLHWGEMGFDDTIKSGTDVRDLLTA